MSKPRSPVEAINALTTAVDYIRITTLDDNPNEPLSSEWIPGPSLVHDPAFLYDTMRSAMDERGIQRDDLGLSLIVQGYAFRIASIAIGTWLLSGGSVDVGPDNVWIQFGRQRPNAVKIGELRWAVAPPAHTTEFPERDTIDLPATDPVADLTAPGQLMAPDQLMALHRCLIDDHLRPLIDTARSAHRVGGAMLWANVASSCASSFSMLMNHRGPTNHRWWAHIRSQAIGFFDAAGPELGTAGHVVPIGPSWAWQRKACCLYYVHADGSKCGDCSLHDDAARAARYERILKEVFP